MWIYKQTEQKLWTVGYHEPKTGKFVPESDHDHPDKAAARVWYLNGGGEKE